MGAEGLGEAVTGGMIARAIEPQAGEASGEAGHEACLNCGTALAGPYCHACGQPGHVHRSVSAWWHDVAHSVLHFEGKMWRTLPLLAWRPGELTRRYIEGERARFVSPMALFLFTVFLMFAVFSLVGSPFRTMDNADTAEVTRERAQLESRVASLEAERRATRDPAAIARLDSDLREARAGQSALDFATGEGGPTEINPDTGWPRLDHAIRKAAENPALVAYKLQSNGYKFSWALIPISLPFLWALFLHRRRYRARYKAYDHLVFITYSISFMSMATIAYVLLGWIGFPAGILGLALVVVPPVHIFRQLRGAYGLGRLSALWRTAVLLIVAFAAMLLFLMLLLAMGAFA